jgi:hypothetical protein
MTTVNWLGETADWMTGGDWDTGSPPGPLDDAVLGGTTSYFVTVSTSAAVKSLIISDGSASLWVNNAGGTLSVSGDLTNSGVLQVFNGTVTIGGDFVGNDRSTLDISSGTMIIGGALSVTNTVAVTLGGYQSEATLDILSAAPTTWNININLLGSALLEFGSGEITTIAAGASIGLGEASSQVLITGDTSNNSALIGLTDIAGDLSLDRGASLATKAGSDLLNSGGIGVSGGTTQLSIGGTLTNTSTGTIQLLADANGDVMLTAANFFNSGEILLQGGYTTQATFDTNATAPTTLVGHVDLTMDALLEFTSGSITGIAQGSFLSIFQSDARVALSSDTSSNSALTQLATNAGTLILESSVINTAASGTDFLNTGSVECSYSSQLDIGGVITNIAGATFMVSSAATATAVGLVNTGTIEVEGSTGNGPVDPAAIILSSNAPTTLTGSYGLSGASIIEFTGGQITEIALGAVLSLGGGSALLTVASDLKSNSALRELSVNKGSVCLQPGGTAGTTIITDAGTNLENDGLLFVAGSGNLPSLFSVGGTLSNFGSVTIDAGGIVSAPALENTGVLIESGFTGDLADLAIGGAVTNGSTIALGPFASIGIGGSVSGAGTVQVGMQGSVAEFQSGAGPDQIIQFTSGQSFPSGVLRLDDPTAFLGTISGLTVGSPGPTNEIDLAKIARGTITSAGLDTTTDKLSITVSGSETVDLQLSGNYLPNTFVNWIADSSGGGSDVFLSNAPCFCRGTFILTDKGEIAVEELTIGDRLSTVSGRVRPIKWIGTRAYDGQFVRNNRGVLPIRIVAGALGIGAPARDLYLSPEHALYLNGLLVPARLLLNGATVIQAEKVESLEYFHVELAEHDIILAEGAAAETYVDCDNRAMFQNARVYEVLYPKDRHRGWQFCAPRLEESAPELRTIRERLLAHAEQIGRMTRDPNLQLVAHGHRTPPQLDANHQFYRFQLAVDQLCAATLASRSVVPAELGVTDDPRRLGVAVEQIVVRDQHGSYVEIRPDDLSFAHGFHKSEHSHRWSDGAGRLSEHLFEALDGMCIVEVYLAHTEQLYPLVTGSTVTDVKDYFGGGSRSRRAA